MPQEKEKGNQEKAKEKEKERQMQEKEHQRVAEKEEKEREEKERDSGDSSNNNNNPNSHRRSHLVARHSPERGSSRVSAGSAASRDIAHETATRMEETMPPARTRGNGRRIPRRRTL